MPFTPFHFGPAAVGGWLHVALDSILYLDIRPFFPAAANPFLGLVEHARLYLLGAFSFLAFVICAGVTGSKNWQPHATTLYHGLAYFSILGILEISGIYTIDWKNLSKRWTGKKQETE